MGLAGNLMNPETRKWCDEVKALHAATDPYAPAFFPDGRPVEMDSEATGPGKQGYRVGKCPPLENSRVGKPTPGSQFHIRHY